MKKVLVGMFALVACAGMAMAHINSVVCPKCKEAISTKTVYVKVNGKSCGGCGETGKKTTAPSLCSKCVEKEKQCQAIGNDAKNGKDGAAQYYFSSGCFE